MGSDSAMAYLDKTGAAHAVARRRFLWWLGGFGYGVVFCLSDPFLRIFDPSLYDSLSDLGLWFIVLLNDRSAFFLALICVIAAIDAFIKTRATWREFEGACEIVRQETAGARSTGKPQ
jgi:hypothetical protein